MAQTNTLHSVEHYCFITLKPESKTPGSRDWLNNGQAFEDAYVHGSNVGIILGAKSGILDVDLDCKEAVALADVLLPSPYARFDRGTNDSCHFLYKAFTFGPRKSLNSRELKSTIVELRGDGAQTMIPPSIHPNGNALTFRQINEDALDVEYDQLLRQVNLLAASAEVAQHWKEGSRHDLSMAFAGLLSKEGVEANLICHIVQRICAITQDSEQFDRLNTVKATLAKPIEKRIGYSGLAQILGNDVAQQISTRIRTYLGKSHLPEPVPQTGPGPVRYNHTSLTEKSNLTEAKVGSVLSDWLKDKALYVKETKQWMLWNNVYWEVDESQKILKLAYQFINEVKSDLFTANKYSEAESMSGFESLKKLENIVKLAAIDLSVSSTNFDDDDMVLAASNIWIDLRSGSAIDPDPNTLVSKALSVGYEPSDSCPMFRNFLNQIFEENEELIRFVQKAIGYSLTGSVSEQCLFIMIGDGANGKSTFINVINQLLGRYGSTAAAQTMIANGRSSIGDDLVDLIGARLITVSETEEGQSLAEAKIKQMTGGDRLKGRPLYGTHIQFNIIGKIWLATNSLPQINNTDFGIWRRIMAIPFHRTFSADEQDKTLSGKLMSELPGILNWAIEGCLLWQSEGLTPPAIVEEQITEYKTSMDSIAQWVQDECKLETDSSYPASKLYEAYRTWCFGVGRKAQSNTSFKRSLEKLEGVHQTRSSSGLRWHGIAPMLISIV